MTVHVVLGGSGFLGRHVVRALLGRGDEVRVVDRTSFPADDSSVPPYCTLLDLVTASAAELEKTVAGADVVHFYAWTTIPQSANDDPERDAHENLGLTVRLLEAVRRQGSTRVIFNSSGGTVYGRLQVIPVPESHPLAPLTAYGASKVAAETYLGFYQDLYGVDVRIARIANPFGAGQDWSRPQGVATTIVHRALTGTPIEVWGDGEVVRDFIHVSDVVTALLRLTDVAPSETRGRAVYNIGSGKGASINEVISSVQRHVGVPLTVKRKPGRPFDVPVNVLDVSAAAAGLDWRPRLDLDQGIWRMINDLRSNLDSAFSSLD